MVRQLPPRPLGVSDKGRKLHKLYQDDYGRYSGCGKRLLDRFATEDEKRAMVHCGALGCAGVP